MLGSTFTSPYEHVWVYISCIALHIVGPPADPTTFSCDDGWINRPGTEDCFFIELGQKTWDNALTNCRDVLDADLASIHSEEENLWLFSNSYTFCYIQ